MNEVVSTYYAICLSNNFVWYISNIDQKIIFLLQCIAGEELRFFFIVNHKTRYLCIELGYQLSLLGVLKLAKATLVAYFAYFRILKLALLKKELQH